MKNDYAIRRAMSLGIHEVSKEELAMMHAI